MTFVNPAGSPAPNPATTTHTATNPLQSLTDPTTFLNLLVAQLKYQDPLNPTSGTQFLSQTAQLTEVETLTSLSKQVTNQLSAQQTLASTSMIGKTITAKLANGTTVKGQVQGVALDPTHGPTLSVTGVSAPIPLNAVTTVGTVT